MRPVYYECPEKFRVPDYATTTVRELLMGFSSDWCYEYAYKI